MGMLEWLAGGSMASGTTIDRSRSVYVRERPRRESEYSSRPSRSASHRPQVRAKEVYVEHVDHDDRYAARGPEPLRRGQDQRRPSRHASVGRAPPVYPPPGRAPPVYAAQGYYGPPPGYASPGYIPRGYPAQGYAPPRYAPRDCDAPRGQQVPREFAPGPGARPTRRQSQRVAPGFADAEHRSHPRRETRGSQGMRPPSSGPMRESDRRAERGSQRREEYPADIRAEHGSQRRADYEDDMRAEPRMQPGSRGSRRR